MTGTTACGAFLGSNACASLYRTVSATDALRLIQLRIRRVTTICLIANDHRWLRRCEAGGCWADNHTEGCFAGPLGYPCPPLPHISSSPGREVQHKGREVKTRGGGVRGRP